MDDHVSVSSPDTLSQISGNSVLRKRRLRKRKLRKTVSFGPKNNQVDPPTPELSVTDLSPYVPTFPANIETPTHFETTPENYPQHVASVKRTPKKVPRGKQARGKGRLENLEKKDETVKEAEEGEIISTESSEQLPLMEDWDAPAIKRRKVSDDYIRMWWCIKIPVKKDSERYHYEPVVDVAPESPTNELTPEDKASEMSPESEAVPTEVKEEKIKQKLPERDRMQRKSPKKRRTGRKPIKRETSPAQRRRDGVKQKFSDKDEPQKTSIEESPIEETPADSETTNVPEKEQETEFSRTTSSGMSDLPRGSGSQEPQSGWLCFRSPRSPKKIDALPPDLPEEQVDTAPSENIVETPDEAEVFTSKPTKGYKKPHKHPRRRLQRPGRDGDSLKHERDGDDKLRPGEGELDGHQPTPVRLSVPLVLGDDTVPTISGDHPEKDDASGARDEGYGRDGAYASKTSGKDGTDRPRLPRRGRTDRSKSPERDGVDRPRSPGRAGTYRPKFPGEDGTDRPRTPGKDELDAHQRTHIRLGDPLYLADRTIPTIYRDHPERDEASGGRDKAHGRDGADKSKTSGRDGTDRPRLPGRSRTDTSKSPERDGIDRSRSPGRAGTYRPKSPGGDGTDRPRTPGKDELDAHQRTHIRLGDPLYLADRTIPTIYRDHPERDEPSGGRDKGHGRYGADRSKISGKDGTDRSKSPGRGRTDRSKSPERDGVDRSRSPGRGGTYRPKSPGEGGTDRPRTPGKDELDAHQRTHIRLGDPLYLPDHAIPKIHRDHPEADTLKTSGARDRGESPKSPGTNRGHRSRTSDRDGGDRPRSYDRDRVSRPRSPGRDGTVRPKSPGGAEGDLWNPSENDEFDAHQRTHIRLGDPLFRPDRSIPKIHRDHRERDADSLKPSRRDKSERYRGKGKGDRSKSPGRDGSGRSKIAGRDGSDRSKFPVKDGGDRSKTADKDELDAHLRTHLRLGDPLFFPDRRVQSIYYPPKPASKKIDQRPDQKSNQNLQKLHKKPSRVPSKRHVPRRRRKDESGKRFGVAEGAGAKKDELDSSEPGAHEDASPQLDGNELLDEKAKGAPQYPKQARYRNLRNQKRKRNQDQDMGRKRRPKGEKEDKKLPGDDAKVADLEGNIDKAGKVDKKRDPLVSELYSSSGDPVTVVSETFEETFSTSSSMSDEDDERYDLYRGKSGGSSIYTPYGAKSGPDSKYPEDQLFRAPSWFRRRMIESDYDPHKHRKQPNPSPNMETMLHIIKCCTGTGILTMPYGFMHAGLFNGIICTIFIMTFTTYCVNVLVKCQYVICKRHRIPMITYPDTLMAAFTVGPRFLRRIAKRSSLFLECLIIFNQTSICAVYSLFICSNVQSVTDKLVKENYVLDKNFYLLGSSFLLISMCMFRTIKAHANIALIGNCLTFFSVSMIFACAFRQWEVRLDAELVAQPTKFPIFFGVALFIFDSTSNIVAIENNMQTPKSFGGFLGVFNLSMMFFTFMVAVVGFLGYLRYGDDVEPVLTLNLPQDDVLANMAKITFAAALTLSYGMQSFVTAKFLIRRVKHSPHYLMWEYFIRISCGMVPLVFSSAVPRLSIMVPLVGALCGGCLKFVIPALIEFCLKYSDGMPLGCWVIIIDILIIAFGVLGMVFGIYYTAILLIESFSK